MVAMCSDEIRDQMAGNLVPWWIADDRRLLEAMRAAVKGKPESAVVRYLGDQRPQTVSQVHIDIECLERRIEADIARFTEAGGDYDKF